MAKLQVDILDPKARKILKDLADLNLIAITELKDDDGFLRIIKKIRNKGKKNPISLDVITKEVELVRTKHYARVKG